MRLLLVVSHVCRFKKKINNDLAVLAMLWYKLEEYKVGDWVLLSTKDLKYQMQGKQLEKLTEWFVGPYKVKRIISTNTIELELPSSIKIHPVINISRVQKYRDKVEGQKKKWPLPVIIEGEKKYEVEKILNKRKFRERDKYLVT